MMIISDHSVQPLVFQSYRKLKNKSIAQTQEQNLFIGFVRISCFYICVLYYTGALNHTLEQALTPGVSTISKKNFDWYLRLEFFYKLVQSSFFLFYKITKNRDPLTPPIKTRKCRSELKFSLHKGHKPSWQALTKQAIPIWTDFL